MQQLSGLDNSFLVMEAGGNLGHVASVGIFAANGSSEHGLFESVKRTIQERLHLLPPYRRRLVEVPFDLDRPYWIEDPDFDLDFHMRHIAVPPPGDEIQLSELVARIHSRPLDRARPLWEAYVIDGLADGRSALYLKLHHCTIDGVSGAEMGQVLLDRSPEGTEIAPPTRAWRPDRLPGGGEMLLRGAGGLVSQPGRAVRIAARTARGLWENDEARGAAIRAAGLEKLPVVGALLRGGGDEIDAEDIPQTPAPRTPFNRSITPHRRFSYFSQSLESYKRVKRAFGTTLNDVVMAVCGTALRRYLLEQGALPEDPLIAMVPVSVRNEGEKNDYGNRVTSILSELATDVEDPVARLRRIHEAMASAKRIQRATPATLLTDWTEIATPALFAQAARIAARTRIMNRMRPPFNVVISNVPGPRESLYCGGFEMQGYYPVSAVADGMGLNITVMSYRDHVDFGLVSCRELVPDIWRFPDLFAEGLEELEKAAEATTG